ncbi:hypothetical protein LOK49_LG10G01101 [Camellia lanceoleosa]|uniref:Uncharacterized protein n=1 Tax=Camellia lanceoleosa TaxID=1840588 RepID=A0ACC0GBQ3_9ERIC|nr:hypothetical protein LOK49_LG10G01101 [Camellia lanceoleosa]
MTKSGAEKKRVPRSSGAIQNGSNRDLNSDTPPRDNMTMDFDERYFHGKPQNSFHKAVNIPNVVVFPRIFTEAISSFVSVP